VTPSFLPSNVKNGNELKDSNIIHKSDDKNIKFTTRLGDLILSRGTSGVLVFGFFFSCVGVCCCEAFSVFPWRCSNIDTKCKPIDNTNLILTIHMHLFTSLDTNWLTYLPTYIGPTYIVTTYFLAFLLLIIFKHDSHLVLVKNCKIGPILT
jgi:hypothetical protein